MRDTHTIVARPGQWLYVNAYEGYDPFRYNNYAESRLRFGVILADDTILPPEVAAELRPSSNGRVYLSGFQRPAVEHYEGWEKLESEIRRMEASNRRRDDLFEDHSLAITFERHVREPKPGSLYDTPLIVFPVKKIAIVSEESV